MALLCNNGIALQKSNSTSTMTSSLPVALAAAPPILRPNRVTVAPRNGLPVVAPPVEFVRNEWGIIVDSFGDTRNAKQCITVNVTAHKADAGQEIVRLTLPIGKNPVIPSIRAYLAAMLPGYELHDWCVWPGDSQFEQVMEPF